MCRLLFPSMPPLQSVCLESGSQAPHSRPHRSAQLNEPC